MNTHRFLPLVAALVLAPAAFLVLAAQKPAEKPAEKVPAGGAAAASRSYTGKSADGNLQAALEDALKQADDAAAKTGADIRYEWTMGAVKGTRGGITGTREVTVEVKVP